MSYSHDAYVEAAKQSKAEEKLKDYVIKDVTVTEEELQADFDAKVASQKETYDATPSSYVSAKNSGSTVYYAPAGVRLVKQILLKFSDADQAVIDELNTKITDKNNAVSTLTSSVRDALGSDTEVTVEDVTAQVKVTMEQPEGVSTVATVSDLTADFTSDVNEDVQDLAKQLAQAQAELAFYQEQLTAAREAGWANLSDKADDILAKLANGADFDVMIAEYNDDSGMASGSTASKNGGYAVCEGYTSFDSDFLAAAMALEKVGDVSGQVRTQFGTYILLYADDVTEGPIDLETVRDSLTSSLLTTKQNDTYDAQVEDWKNADGMKITTHRDLLDD